MRYKFRRQHPIGSYIVDFACTEYQLVIEVDGSQHAESANDSLLRTPRLQSRGWRVLRFWNNDVFANTSAVVEKILGVLERR